jgi:putative pyruvate formate lyase activating enzyme
MALSLLESCSLCPRSCGVNRLAGDMGKCRTSRQAIVSSYGPHLGEEAPLVGRYGSGTIFFANCNLGCLFCQNYSISQLGEGHKVDKEELAYIMLSLQEDGCHNINLVSPTHVVPQILEALELAVESGLKLPLVYNTGGYDSVDTLKLLDCIVDIYMPDMKYDDEETARELSGVRDYPEANKAAVKEMHRQTGDLEVDKEGVAQRGLLIRHLVLPEGLAGTETIMRFLSEEISGNTYVNIMAQYRPSYKALQIPGLGRRISSAEFHEALSFALEAGLRRVDKVHPTELLPTLSE